MTGGLNGRRRQRLRPFFKTGYAEEQSIRWGITLKPQDKVIGTCGFSDFDHFSRAELGYELSMEYQHQGIMSEVLRAIIPFAFHELEMHRIQASVFPENSASIHLLEKFGFKREGVLRQYTFIRHRGGVWEDCLVLALLKMNLKRGLTPHLWEGAPIRFCGISIYNLIVLVVFIALLGGILGAVYGPGILKLAKEPDVFLEFIAGLGPWGGALVFVGIQVLQIIVPPIPGELVQIAAGYIFGPLLGTVYLLLGALLAQQWPFILPVFWAIRLSVLWSRPQNWSACGI